jgi:hypothetical protein
MGLMSYNQTMRPLRLATTVLGFVIILNPCLGNEPHTEPMTFTPEPQMTYTPSFTATSAHTSVILS